MNKLFCDIIEKFEDPEINDDEILEMAIKLADSGQKMTFNGDVYDFASTGGPSSLTTLLVPLYLYDLGVNVINLGVPGRPAGAIDVLSQIPGYNSNINDLKIDESKHFYYHLEANEKFTPLDKLLFDYRKKIGKINVPNLAIASLLSKKIAAGANNIGLDVRVSNFGNFGKNWTECINNANKYNRLAKKCGLTSKCFLSEASIPYQPYIGRGEALEAIFDILNNNKNNMLDRHNKYCEKIAKILTGLQDINKTIDLNRALSENLFIQGSSIENFFDMLEILKKQKRKTIYATESGYIKYDLIQIRNYIVFRQSQCFEKYPDPTGIKLLKCPGQKVLKNEPIMEIRNSILEYEKNYVFFEIEKNNIQDINYREEVI